MNHLVRAFLERECWLRQILPLLLLLLLPLLLNLEVINPQIHRVGLTRLVGSLTHTQSMGTAFSGWDPFYRIVQTSPTFLASAFGMAGNRLVGQRAQLGCLCPERESTK